MNITLLNRNGLVIFNRWSVISKEESSDIINTLNYSDVIKKIKNNEESYVNTNKCLYYDRLYNFDNINQTVDFNCPLEKGSILVYDFNTDGNPTLLYRIK